MWRQIRTTLSKLRTSSSRHARFRPTLEPLEDRCVPNGAPVGQPDFFQVVHNQSLFVPSNGVLANDSDPDQDSLTALVVGQPAHGNLALEEDGSFLYSPYGGWAGIDEFSYVAFDGQATSDVTLVQITLLDSAPVAVNDYYGTGKDELFVAGTDQSVFENDFDPEGDWLHSMEVVSGPANGTLFINEALGTFSYLPNPGFTGIEQFDYRVFAGALPSNVGRVFIAVLGLEVDQINFSGPANVPLQMDISGNALFESIGPFAGVEWVRGNRDLPNTHAPWTKFQSTPAAYVRNQPLFVHATFSTAVPLIEKLGIRGEGGGGYGNLVLNDPVPPPGGAPGDPLPVLGGTAQGYFQSVASINTVNVDDFTFTWQLTSITFSGGPTIPVLINLRETTHRIYTLYAQPLDPMSTPWAPVLELSAGLAKGRNTTSDILRDLTIGIHESRWQVIRDSVRFLDPRATLAYQTGAFRARPAGPPDSPFATQLFDLTNLLSFLGDASFVEECTGNSDFQAVMARSLGVPLTPLWIGPIASEPRLNLATYFPAGSSDQTQTQFLFHQFGFVPAASGVLEDGLVYDPSLRGNANGGHFVGITLRNYLDAVFPDQRDDGYVHHNVQIQIGTVPNAPFRIGPLPPFQSYQLPGEGDAPIVISFDLQGAGFDANLKLLPAIGLVNRQAGGTYIFVAQGIQIQNFQVVSPNRIKFDVVISSAAVANIPAGQNAIDIIFVFYKTDLNEDEQGIWLQSYQWFSDVFRIRIF